MSDYIDCHYARSRADQTQRPYLDGTIAAGTVVVDVEVHDANDVKRFQWYDEQVTFSAGQTRTFPVTWQVPATISIRSALSVLK